MDAWCFIRYEIEQALIENYLTVQAKATVIRYCHHSFYNFALRFFSFKPLMSNKFI
jgi:hypothetical protein